MATDTDAETLAEDTQAEGRDIGAMVTEGNDAAAAGTDPDPVVEERERIAAAMGWSPKDQWKGPPEQWKPAKDFLADSREILFDTRKKARRLEEKLNRVEPLVQKLQARLNQSDDADFEDRLAAAAEEGPDAVRKLYRERAKQQAEPEKAGPSEAFAAFQERNNWFGVDEAATAYASSVGARLAAQGMTEDEASYKKVEAEVKRRFPELFGDGKPANDGKDEPKDKGAGPVLNRGSRTPPTQRAPGKLTVADATPQHRRAAETMGVELKDYMDSLNKQALREQRAAS